MRHRSAARYTWDQPDALAVVVSEDGPVTVYRAGEPVSESAAIPTNDPVEVEANGVSPPPV
jgi:hypothetical protein